MNFQILKKNIVSEVIMEEFNRHRVTNDKSVFCFSPFNSLLFESDGRVFACCHNYKYDFGTYPAKSIDEMWNGEKMARFRKAIKKNDLSQGCDVCRFDIDTKCFDTVQSLMFDNLPVNKNGYPSMLDFKLDSTCNLECIMCDGMHSSSIKKNKEKRIISKSPYDDDFINQLEKYIPHLHTARFSGGEPFLINIYYKIWERIIKINPGCIIRVQTNGSVLNDKIRDLLNRGNFELNISLDSVSQITYEKIRKHSDFEKAINNIKYFSGYSRQRNKFFGVTICPLRINREELPSIVNFCSSIGAVIWFSNVWLPPQVAIWTLGSDELKEIYLKLKDVQLPDGSNVERDNKKLFKDFVIVLEKWYRSASEREKNLNLLGFSKFKKFINKSIKAYCGKYETDREQRKVKVQFLLNKVENIAEKFNPKDKIIKEYIDTIIENSSAYQLIDMFEGTPEEEISEIISSFIPKLNR
jgi:radical SAM protein with 4Fe4S-binding SPASM domain